MNTCARIGVVIGLLVLTGIGTAPAATVTWTNGTSGLWTNGANWIGGTSPGVGDTVNWTSKLSNVSLTIQTNIIGVDGQYSANTFQMDWNGLTFKDSGTLVCLTGAVATASLSLTNLYVAYGDGSSGGYGALNDTLSFSNMNLFVGYLTARGVIQLGQKVGSGNFGINGVVTATGTNATFTAYLSQLLLGFGGANGQGNGVLDLSQARAATLDVSGNVEIAGSSSGGANFQSGSLLLNNGDANVGNLYVAYTTASETQTGTTPAKNGAITLTNTIFRVATNGIVYLGGRGKNSNLGYQRNIAAVNITVAGLAGGLDIQNTNSAGLTLKYPTLLNADGANYYNYNQINVTLGYDATPHGGWIWGLRWAGDHVTNNTTAFTAGGAKGLVALLDSTNQYARLRVITNMLTTAMFDQHLAYLKTLNPSRYGGKTTADLTPADFIVYDGGYTYVGVHLASSYPEINNASGATGVSQTSANLNGILLSTGAAPTTVFAYWGMVDGGTNSWANTNIWGAPQLPGDFTFHVSGLSPNTNYYYRFAATNQFGVVWTTNASAFITGDVWLEKLSDASEIGPTPGTFAVHRASTTTNGALVVNYTVNGTASNGVDYAVLSGSIPIPAGTDTVALVISPYYDHLLEGVETVEVTLGAGPYIVGASSNAVLNIVDLGVVTNTWGGGGADALASNPTNWTGGAVPLAGDAILLNATTNKNMTWNLNIPVQSWMQIGYAGTVTIATVYGPAGFTNLDILGDCTISNGVWTHSANGATEVYRLKATIGGNLNVGTNGVIDVTAKGYPDNGPGGANGKNAGGSYGGKAGEQFGVSGACYGSIVAPTNLGSAGNYSGTHFAGGGAIWLNVAGRLNNGGVICADGKYAWIGSGSGGSIYISAGLLTGAGVIRANGGPADYGGTAGGGGRVALVVTNTGADFSLFTGTVQATGPGSGTLYLRTAAQSLNRGTLLISGGFGSSLTEVNANVTDAVVGDVLIRNGCLTVSSNQTLVLSGVWSNAANFTAQSGSRVVFAGGASSTSTIYGVSTFMGLTCTNGGKTLLFQAGKTNLVAAYGTLALSGSGSPL